MKKYFNIILVFAFIAVFCADIHAQQMPGWGGYGYGLKRNDDGSCSPIDDAPFKATGGLLLPNQYGVNTAGVVFSGGFDIPPLAFGDYNFMFAWGRNTTSAVSQYSLFIRSSGVIKALPGLLGASAIATHVSGGSYFYPNRVVSPYDWDADGWGLLVTAGANPLTSSIAVDPYDTYKAWKIIGPAVVVDTAQSKIVGTDAAFATTSPIRLGGWIRFNNVTGLPAEATNIFPVGIGEGTSTITDSIKFGMRLNSTGGSTTHFVVNKVSNGATTNTVLSSVAGDCKKVLALDTLPHFVEIYVITDGTIYIYVDGSQVYSSSSRLLASWEGPVTGQVAALTAINGAITQAQHTVYVKLINMTQE